MNLIGLKAKNLKILKAVDIDFKKKGVVYISGKNDQGKSTLIDSIHIALAGKSHYKDQSKMRRRGISDEDESFVIAKLDEYTVKRWFTPTGNDYIEIRNNDDIKQGSPETLLQKFYSDHCRNPQEMIDMSKDEQVQFLYALMNIEEAIAEINSKHEAIYMDRRDVNRDLKKAKCHLESLEEPATDIPDKVDVSETSRRLTEAQNFNAGYKKSVEEVRDLETGLIPDQQEQIEDTQREIEILEKKLAAERERLSNREERLAELEGNLAENKKWLKNNDKIDTGPLTEKIDKAEEINQLHQRLAEYQKAEQQVKELEKQSGAKTEKLEALEAEKQKILEDGDLPMDGVSVTDGEIHKDGLPVSQLSTTESIKFWSKLYIATNPRLRLLTLHRGESLDSDNQKALEAFAEENDILYIVEMVDEDGQTGVVIENGMVKRNLTDK